MPISASISGKRAVHGVDEVHLLRTRPADADHPGQVGGGRADRGDGGPAGGGARLTGRQHLDDGRAPPR